MITLWLLACSQVVLRSDVGQGTVQARPSHVSVEAVYEGNCPATDCCGASDIGEGGELACCGMFPLEVKGSDTITSMAWTPGSQSRLELIVDVFGPIDLTRDWVSLPVCYRMVGDKAPRCRDEATEDCETGLPPDDGLLELALRESGAVDVWVEVQ